MPTRTSLGLSILDNTRLLIAVLALTVKPSIVAADVSTQPAHPTTSQSVEASTEDSPSCEALVARADNAKAPSDRCRASLEAARCILVSQCSSALTRELCGAADEGVLLRDAAYKALAHLTAAEKALEEADFGEENADELRACMELMRTFATVFGALGGAPTTGPARDELLTACGGLAEYFDDPRSGVSEAAKLWQGVAYRRAGRFERALQVLRPVLSVPGARRIGLWARMERCRALGDQGDYAAAVALNLRLSARVDAWFEEEDPTTRRQAADSVRWVRIELLHDWARRLKKDGLDDRATEAEEDADRLLASDAWPPELDRWLSLGPPVADLPECKVEPASKPAESP